MQTQEMLTHHMLCLHLTPRPPPTPPSLRMQRKLGVCSLRGAACVGVCNPPYETGASAQCNKSRVCIAAQTHTPVCLAACVHAYGSTDTVCMPMAAQTLCMPKTAQTLCVCLWQHRHCVYAYGSTDTVCMPKAARTHTCVRAHDRLLCWRRSWRPRRRRWRCRRSPCLRRTWLCSSSGQLPPRCGLVFQWLQHSLGATCSRIRAQGRPGCAVVASWRHLGAPVSALTDRSMPSA